MFRTIAVLLAASSLGLAMEQKSGESTLAVDSQQFFASYKASFKRTYAEGSEEHTMRERLFNERMAQIEAHNAAGKSWKEEANQFTDRTDEEKAVLHGYRRQPTQSSRGGSSLVENDNIGNADSCGAAGMSCMQNDQPGCCDGFTCARDGKCMQTPKLPTDLDWVPQIPGSTSLLDQGACGSCWAVAAAAAIQMHATLDGVKFEKNISPQGILGCSPNPRHCGGTGGCEGSVPELAFEWAKTNAINTLASEDYTATTTCPNKKSFMRKIFRGLQRKQDLPSFKIGGYIHLPENKGDRLQAALVTAGPVAVAAAAGPWHAYSSGVFDGCRKATVVDHAILMMGYGLDGDNHYWKIRNSWGPYWGEQGFIRLRRHANTKDEPCGWDNDPKKGVGCDGGPKRLWVCGECGILSDSAYPVATYSANAASPISSTVPL